MTSNARRNASAPSDSQDKREASEAEVAFLISCPALVTDRDTGSGDGAVNFKLQDQYGACSARTIPYDGRDRVALHWWDGAQ